jgi:hypothetical protein
LTQFAIAQNKYPIQTIFKGDSVIILTKDQALEINKTIENKNLFISNYKKEVKCLKDTIRDLKWDLITTDASLQRKIEKFRDSLDRSNNIIYISERQISYYKEQMKRIEKLEYVEKKVRRRVTVGIGAAVVTWWTIFLLSTLK